MTGDASLGRQVGLAQAKGQASPSNGRDKISDGIDLHGGAILFTYVN